MRTSLDLIMDSDRANPLFRSPIGTDRERPLQVLDIGTGKGTWAIDVADMFPNATVRGVDLFPPPVTWMPSRKMAPGGWIERIEVGPFVTSDDGSLPADSALST
ncbi:hypothetical protein N7530_007087 [Penicillium desertorum]|uniref:Methyltransferase domain-containing protein n=1 Tax=Penicillium desertorum TaxID=1303715 RepID=A0A9W9WSY3_9EURO|nr:hypothetical protein N7530_007087 [Penicillium desertorum]